MKSLFDLIKALKSKEKLVVSLKYVSISAVLNIVM